jgi:sulfur-oxidizing protein SoxA
LLSLTALIAYQSRGLPIAPDTTPQVQPHLEMGRQLFMRRMGQLNLSCAQCHDERAGLRLGGSIIPQGHPTGYPIYRIEWQNMGSLQRRLRSCMTGVRAERYDFGSQELLSLELYLMHRAKGMTIESPAVRP